MKPAVFLAYLDDSVRAMVIAKLKAVGVKPERVMNDENTSFSALQKALGKHNFEMLIQDVAKLDATIKMLTTHLDDPVRFIAAAAAVPDDVVARLGGSGTLQANKGLGCPEALAKASALAKALHKFVPEANAKLAVLEEKLWDVMRRDCTVLSTLTQRL